MGIRRPFSVGDGFVAPETPEGGLYALIDGTGKYYSAGWEGETQKHPLALTGGQRIFLGTGGLQADATSGYNVITGTGVSQTADGLVVTLNVGNPEVIIDLPVFGAGVFWEAYLEVDIVNATPADDNRVGIRYDSNSASYVSGVYALFYAAGPNTWNGALDLNGTDFFGANGVSLANVDCVRCESFSGTSDVRKLNASIGLAGEYNGKSSFAGNLGGETITAPTTWDLSLRAMWFAGSSDLVVTFKAITVVEGPLSPSTVS